MTTPGPWATRVLAGQPRQPDAFSCGAASLVMARALADERYAELLVTGRHPGTGWTVSGTPADRFRSETLGMHRRITGATDIVGRLQVPWPRFFGTPPWAVSRQLRALGTPYVVRQALVGRERAFDDMQAGIGSGHPSALYVGDRWASRHVVLAYAADAGELGVFDPASGRTETVSVADFTAARLPFGRWLRPWFVIRPRR